MRRQVVATTVEVGLYIDDDGNSTMKLVNYDYTVISTRNEPRALDPGNIKSEPPGHCLEYTQDSSKGKFSVHNCTASSSSHSHHRVDLGVLVDGIGVSREPPRGRVHPLSEPPSYPR